MAPPLHRPTVGPRQWAMFAPAAFLTIAVLAACNSTSPTSPASPTSATSASEGASATTVDSSMSSGGTASSGPSEAYATALNYVTRFYPRWFTFTQQNLGRINVMAGPDEITPELGIVVAINDDTLYAQGFIDATKEPVILTIPETQVSYSLLTVDVYGNIFPTTIQPQTPGVYGLTGPSSQGTLPEGVTKVEVPNDVTIFTIRADRYHDGVDETTQADQFRQALHLATLSDYTSQGPSAGPMLVVPVFNYRPRLKNMADQALTNSPTGFMTQLQTAMHDPTTPPLSATDKPLADAFDAIFTNADFASQTDESNAQSGDLNRGATAAHTLLQDNYLSNRGTTNWINFQNIGEWGTAYIDRASIAEYIMFGNSFNTAAYYQTFVDGTGVPLDCAITPGYVLTFAKDHLPATKRFWSVTAYTPDSIELVPNSADVYLVASYTPGLVTGADGSVSIYMQPEAPTQAPKANWLPVPKGPFNVMLRDYGPEGTVAAGQYVPPAVTASASAN